MSSVPTRSPRSNSSSHHRTGHLALGIAVGIAGVTAAVGLLLPRGFFLHRAASSAVMTSSAAMTTELVPGALASWLGRVGLDPRGLAAAGVDPGQISGLAVDARAHLTEHVASLNTAQDAADAARAALQTHEARVRAGLASAEEVSLLASFRSSNAQAQAALDSAKAAFVSASTASLTEGQRAALASLARNAGREVPLAYRLVDRNALAWLTLRNDLAHTRVANQRGESSNPDVAQRLATANSDPTVASSLSNSQSNLQPIVAAWTNATR